MFEPTAYEIVIRGRANARVLHPLLDDFVCDRTDDAVTRLIGELRDPAHLHGVVAHLTSMNAELISIKPIEAPAAASLALDLAPHTAVPTTKQEWTTNP